MIIYNVTVKMDHSIEEEWVQWMKEKHVPDVMATGFFASSKMMKMISPAADQDGVTYAVQYMLNSMKDLHQYQVEKAPALQKEHQAKFAGKLGAFRTILEEV